MAREGLRERDGERGRELRDGGGRRKIEDLKMFLTEI